jgi:small subunit ribosomal protein S14
MATKALVEKMKLTPKFMTRHRNRCQLCGRPRGYIRMFKMCRMCFRKNALEGLLPGVKKTSW